MSLNISERTMSLIVQNYLSHLVLFTKKLYKRCHHFSLKKEEIGTWSFDYSGFGIKNILFEWTQQFTYIFVSVDDKKMSCFYNATKMLWSVGHTAVRYWIYSTFSCVFHSGLIFMLICLCFVKLVMRYQLVTFCYVIGGCAVPWSTSQPDV